MQTMTDAQLLEAYSSRQDDNAFAELMRRHTSVVYRTCHRLLKDAHEAEDAAQAVFVVLARKAAGLRKGDLSAWLYRVAHHVAAETVRKRMHRTKREESYAAEEVILAESSAAGDIPDPALLGLVDAALLSLPDRYREAVILRYLRNRSETEAAQLAGCAVGTLSMRASRGIQRLRQHFARRGVTLSGAALVGLLASEASAAVPETLLPSILASVKGLAAATAAGTGATSTAVILAKGAMKAMFIAKVKTVSLAAAACLVVAGTGVVAAKQLAGSSTPAPSETTIMEPATTPVLVAAAPVPPTPAQPPAVPPAPVAPKAAEQPLRFTEADNGKTVTVKVGQKFEVVLLNGREGAGWEPAATEITGASVERVNKLRRGNCDERMTEKAPTPDTTLGMYKYKYNAVKPGTSIIRVVHVYPSGPTPKPRTATLFISEFKLIVEVTADGAAATPAVNEYQAQQLAQLWVSGLLAGRVDQVLAVSDLPFCWDKREVVKTAEELKAKFAGVIKTKGARNLQAGEATLLKDAEAVAVADRFQLLDTPGLVYVLVKIPNPEKPRGPDTVLLAIKPGAEFKVVGFSD